MFSNRLRKGTKSKLDSSWHSYTVHIHIDYLFCRVEYSRNIIFECGRPLPKHLCTQGWAFFLSVVFSSFCLIFHTFFFIDFSQCTSSFLKAVNTQTNTQITFTQYPYTAPCLRAQNRQMQSRSAKVNYPLNMKVLNERKRKALKKARGREKGGFVIWKILSRAILYLIKEWFDIKMECWEWICVGLEKTLWLSDPLKLNLLLPKPDKIRSRVSRWREKEWWSARDSISLSIYWAAAKMMHVALTGLFLSDENSK